MTHLDECKSFLTSLRVQASSVTTLLPTFTTSERCYGGIFLRHRYHDVIHHCKSSSGFPMLKAKVKTLRERPCRGSFPSLSGCSSSLMSEHFSLSPSVSQLTLYPCCMVFPTFIICSHISHVLFSLWNSFHLLST